MIDEHHARVHFRDSCRRLEPFRFVFQCSLAPVPRNFESEAKIAKYDTSCSGSDVLERRLSASFERSVRGVGDSAAVQHAWRNVVDVRDSVDGTMSGKYERRSGYEAGDIRLTLEKRAGQRCRADPLAFGRLVLPVDGAAGSSYSTGTPGNHSSDLRLT